MGLLDSFMAGETGGMPDGGYGATPINNGMNGLLSGSNPLFNIGLGILANNQGHYGAFGPAFGMGAQQGIQNTQNAQSLALKNKLYGIQAQQEQQKNAEYQRKLAALQAFKDKFPDYATAVDLDPALAIKAAYPNLAGKAADPYFQFLPTASGYAAGDARTGKVELVTDANGNPYIKSADSPQVRGAVKSAEAQATASMQPNTDINGLITTNEQIARAVYGNQPMPFQSPAQAQPQMPPQQNGLPTNNFSTPYPVTFGAPGTTATDRTEGVVNDQSIQLRNPANPNRPVGGIKIPTKAEQAAAVKTAEMNAENTTKAQIDLPSTVAQAENTLGLVDQLVGSKDGKIKPHPGLDVATGLSSKLDPRNYLAGTEATNFNIRLDQLKGQQFMQAYQNLKGGGQITEVEGKKATDAISRMNSRASEEEFVKAARDFQDVIRAGVNRAKMRSGNMEASKSSAISAGGWSAKKVP